MCQGGKPDTGKLYTDACLCYSTHTNGCVVNGLGATAAAYISRCRFGFPRPVSANAAVNPLQETLKSHNRIYKLTRTESEVRVNDYSPLLLMLWKANIDIQG